MSFMVRRLYDDGKICHLIVWLAVLLIFAVAADTESFRFDCAMPLTQIRASGLAQLLLWLLQTHSLAMCSWDSRGDSV